MFPVIWLKGREINLPKKKKKNNSKTAKNSKRLNQYNQE